MRALCFVSAKSSSGKETFLVSFVVDLGRPFLSFFARGGMVVERVLAPKLFVAIDLLSSSSLVDGSCRTRVVQCMVAGSLRPFTVLFLVAGCLRTLVVQNVGA